MTINLGDEFNWSKYDNYKGGSTLVPNRKVKGQSNKSKCFSRENYAQDFFNQISTDNIIYVKKDLIKGDCVPITHIYNIRAEKITIGLSSGLSIDIDLDREKRFLQLFGYETIDLFVADLNKPDFLEKFISYGIYAYVIESNPTIKVSLWQGHLKSVREEFMAQIQKPNKAYVAKVKEANRGGYFVEVQGVDAFMPGSLAAPNKIMDFRSLIGKEVVVMIEDFLIEMNSFIVSHKKYIEYVLPKKIDELDQNKLYTGYVTGTSKYGIFVEFEDICTGLLHTSKMKPETLNKFNQNRYDFTSGTPLNFFINEITKDNRIILTEESPDEKKNKMNLFVEKNKDIILESEIAAIMNFGIITNVNDISGLIPNKEFKRLNVSPKNFVNGDKLKVKIAEFKDDKIFFELIV